jgi:hypothetical protein
VASGIKEYCSVYASAIPNLSPAENAWLDREIQDGRGMSAIGSLEFLEQQAGDRSRNCVVWAGFHIAKLDVNPTQTVDRNEAFLWAQIASNIL